MREPASFLEQYPLLRGTLNLVVSTVIVLGPLIGYISQYREIQRNQTTGAFSIWICLILFVSNTLRILYWLGERYEIALLLQSECMLMMQFILLELCVNVRRRTGGPSARFPSIRHFWNWEDYVDYVLCIAWFALFMSMLTGYMTLYLHSTVYSVILGYAALLIEATLGLPQVIDICRKRSTKGLSWQLILTWLLGDAFKIAYFALKHSPTPFIVCGSIQLTMDCLIGAFICLDASRKSPES